MHMYRKIGLVVAIVILIALISLGLWFYVKPAKGKPAHVTVAYSPFESTALVWIAEDQHYFTENNLKISFRKYDSGAESLDGMLNGEADIVVGATEFPLVGRVLKKKRPRVIGSIDKGEFIYLIGRKDRGIKKPSDLKGKKVGTTIGTIAEFHLGRFLDLNGLSSNDITLVDLKKPEEWVNSVADGDVDAVVTAQPYARSAKERLGGNAFFRSVQSEQPLFALAMSTDEWIAKNPDVAVEFLRALKEAEEYLITHPAESKAIVRKRLNLEEAYMDQVWSQNKFSLSLDQSLILAMEDEARWMIDNNLTPEKEVPDFVDYIHEEGLTEVKPEAVGIIRKDKSK